MWRSSSKLLIQSKKSIRSGKPVGSRNSSGKAASVPTSTIVSVGGAAALTVVGGSVILAKASDGYRDFTQRYIPGTTSLYNFVLGPQVIKTDAPEIIPDDGLMKKKLEREAIKKKDAGLVIFRTEGSSARPAPKVVLEPPTPTPLKDPSPPKEIPVLKVEAPPKDAEPLKEVAPRKEAAPPKKAKIPPAKVEEEKPVIVLETVQEPSAPPETEVVPPVVLVIPEEIGVEVLATVSEPAAELPEFNIVEFHKLLGELQGKAADAVTRAVEMQNAAAFSVKRNVELIYKALEIIYDPEQTPENVWQPVFQSTQDKTRAIQLAEETAKEARMAVALLKETVADAIKNDRSIETPDLITLDENVARALYSLETAKARVEAAQTELKIMAEYRDLVDTARNNLQLELSSMRPEMTPSFNAGDSKLGEEELHILMAHAYWKILTLQKEMAKQQAQEQDRLKTALEIQRKEDTIALENRLRVELERQYYELKAQYAHELARNERILSEQFTQQLKRQAAAHADHLKDMLHAQKEDLQLKHELDMQLQEASLKTDYNEGLAKMLGLAKGIQDSIRARADKERLARQVRDLWMAAQSLVDVLRSDKTAHLNWEAQRLPLNRPLGVINHVVKDDEFVKTIIETIPSEVVEKGVLPQGAIKERFGDVERVCSRVALIDDNGGSLLMYAMSYLQSMLFVRTNLSRAAKEQQEVDVDKLDTLTILAKSRYYLEKDDLYSALRFMNLLRGEPMLVAKDWLKEVRLHLETVQAAEAILMHASAMVIEVM